MARYSALLGNRVEVQYRSGDIFFPATATLVADSGKSIFLEEHFRQAGTLKSFRWEIPYPCIITVRECAEEAPQSAPEAAAKSRAASQRGSLLSLKDQPEKA